MPKKTKKERVVLSVLGEPGLNEKITELAKEYNTSKSKMMNALLSFSIQYPDREKLISFLDKKLRFYY
jgi:hypothetical protein